MKATLWFSGRGRGWIIVLLIGVLAIATLVAAEYVALSPYARGYAVARLAVQEAMSYGLPVIVARGDGTQDDLVRQGNGWQIPNEDYPALLSALQEALSGPERLRRMGAESYRIVREEINIEKMVGVFLEALDKLVNQTSRRV